MSSLNHQTCVPCRGGEPKLTDEEIAKFQSQISPLRPSGFAGQANLWDVIDNHGVKKLTRSFVFKNFKEALEFVNKVGELAESQGHHPEIEFGWGHATVTWWTHKIGGLHHNDFIMAAKTDVVKKI